MAAKRTSAISILSALMLIASFLAAFAPQSVSPRPVFADTYTQEFKSSGTFTPTITGTVTVLVIGAGGGGGYATMAGYPGGGGGGGGVIYNTSYPVTNGVGISVTIGTSGTGSTSASTLGGTGGSTIFGSLTAVGGGGGGSCRSCGNPGQTGGNGGSGGGGGVNTCTSPYYGGGGSSSVAPEGTQGYNGAAGHYASGTGGGGGGGAAARGTSGSSNNGGTGGTGSTNYNSLFNNAITVATGGTFAGGGGGGAGGSSGSKGTATEGGGNGGYGTLSATNNKGLPGTTNSGGGGGGGGGDAGLGYGHGGNGGSGYVIVMWTTNSAPEITDVTLYNTADEAVTSMTPQVEYYVKVTVGDANTLNDLDDITVYIYYDADGTYNEQTPAANTQTCAILTWTNPNTWAIDPSASTTWTQETSTVPTLTEASGDFKFNFKPGKVATESPGGDEWHIYVVVDDGTATDSAYQEDCNMNWYGEIVVNTGTINWGEVSAGLDFAEGDPSEETGISITYICNGAYNQQINSSATWTGSPSGSATLNTGGTPGANEFSLKADDDGTLDASVTVSNSYQTFDTGTLTSESGNAETGNSLWLKLGTPCTKATYSGTMYYQIAH